MTARVRLASLTALVLAALTGCWDKKADDISPSADTCKPEFYRTLPAGKQRDALVEKCMTQGQYRAPEPQTF